MWRISTTANVLLSRGRDKALSHAIFRYAKVTEFHTESVHLTDSQCCICGARCKMKVEKGVFVAVVVHQIDTERFRVRTRGSATDDGMHRYAPHERPQCNEQCDVHIAASLHRIARIEYVGRKGRHCRRRSRWALWADVRVSRGLRRIERAIDRRADREAACSIGRGGAGGARLVAGPCGRSRIVVSGARRHACHAIAAGRAAPRSTTGAHCSLGAGSGINSAAHNPRETGLRGEAASVRGRNGQVYAGGTRRKGPVS